MVNNLIYVTPDGVRANKYMKRVFKDAFGNELNIGDKVVFGNYYGDVYKGEVFGFTKDFVKIKYPSLYKGDFYTIYKTPSKICKV